MSRTMDSMSRTMYSMSRTKYSMGCTIVNCMCRSWMNWMVKWQEGSYRGEAMTHCMVWRCVKMSYCMVSCKMRECSMSCRVGHNWC